MKIGAPPMGQPQKSQSVQGSKEKPPVELLSKEDDSAVLFNLSTRNGIEKVEGEPIPYDANEFQALKAQITNNPDTAVKAQTLHSERVLKLLA